MPLSPGRTARIGMDEVSIPLEVMVVGRAEMQGNNLLTNLLSSPGRRLAPYPRMAKSQMGIHAKGGQSEDRGTHEPDSSRHPSPGQSSYVTPSRSTNNHEVRFEDGNDHNPFSVLGKNDEDNVKREQ